MTGQKPFTLEVKETASSEELAGISEGLGAYNAADVGPSGRQALSVLIHEGETVTGGLSGFTAWGWLYVQWLFVPETLRGKGLSGTLLDAAETEALARGCHGAWIDTFNPAALRVYERQGYTIFGKLDDFPQGRMRWFLQKRLTAGAVSPPA